MLEYIKRKLCRIEQDGIKFDSFPQYYEENDKIIKELEDGQKFIIDMSSDGEEIIIEKIK